MLIHFTDGTSITTQEAAALIRQEGRLTSKVFVGPDALRCVRGVVDGWGVDSISGKLFNSRTTTPGTMYAFREALGKSIDALNDDFQGTPEERAEYMAGLLEGLC